MKRGREEKEKEEAAPARRRLADPRRRSGASAGASSSSTARHRRRSTTRENQIVVATDGFTFKKKRHVASAPPAEVEPPATASRKQPGKKVPPPKYPPVLSAAPATDDTPPEVAVQQYFEDLLQQHTEAVSAVYVEPHDYVAKAVDEVGRSFLRELKETHVMKSIKDLRALAGTGFKNPQNALLATHESCWTEFAELVQTEEKQWQDLAKQESNVKIPEVASTGPVNMGDVASVPAFVVGQDREFVSKTCGGVLNNLLEDNLKDASIRSDVVLTTLKRVSVAVSNAAAANKHVAASLSRAHGVRQADPRALIGGMM